MRRQARRRARAGRGRSRGAAASIAKHRDSDVAGRELLATAFGVARRASTIVGAAARALDAGDEAVARVWTSAPYNFRRSKDRRRLSLPMTTG